ncbi:class I SAM-dependent methyltransferase [Dyadobacter diqingensis]|uniref:class I SAM-dependent methyltransferase n=1 Tax=Dyadobacter diqingensis TaxID=2938121 RepID=UPI0020C1AD7A|nr:class I SAM-dependent methyltransferase [Dyadobacter diqingensis]
MKKEWSEEELKEVARQLGNPDGANGVKTGERMNLSNANMINRGVESLDIKTGETILEIGPGNGSHVGSIIGVAEKVIYHGIDISETMILEANKSNEDLVASGKAIFTLSDGNKLDFQDDFFDKIFTVNTVYFWQDPVAYAKEIFRVLKPGGVFSLVFSDKSFMEQLPFTKFGFQLYDKNLAETLLKQSGFSVSETIEEIETTQSNLGEFVDRPIVIMRATK